MSEEFNPYVNPESNQTAQPGYAAPQSPQQQQMPFQPQAYVYPPQPTNAQRVNYRAYAAQKSSSGAAKAFGIVSFIIGCFVLMIASMIFFNFRTTVTQKYNEKNREKDIPDFGHSVWRNFAFGGVYYLLLYGKHRVRGNALLLLITK